MTYQDRTPSTMLTHFLHRFFQESQEPFPPWEHVAAALFHIEKRMVQHFLGCDPFILVHLQHFFHDVQEVPHLDVGGFIGEEFQVKNRSNNFTGSQLKYQLNLKV